MKHGIDFEDNEFCKHTAFKSTSSFLQHCRDKGNNFHASTAYYLDQLYFKSAGIYDNQVDSIRQSSSFIENVVDSNVIVGEKDGADINVDVEIDDSYEGQNDKDHVDLIQEVDSEEKQEPPFPKVIDDNIIEQQEADKEEGDNISEDLSVKASQQKGKRIILNESGDDTSECSRFSHSDDFVTSEAGGEKIGGSEDEDDEKADEDNKVDGESESVSAVRMARDRHRSLDCSNFSPMTYLQEEVGDGMADFVSTTHSDDQSVSKLLSKQTSARREQKTPHVGHLLFLYYGVFTMVPRNNVPIQNEDMSGLIVDIIMSRKMSITSTTISLNAEVASWNKSNKSISLLMVLESNVGEDGLSAQSTY
jgi:hypothetical protein